MHSIKTTVKLHNTDAAGLLFFGDQFTLAHDAYESFMEHIGFSFARIIHEAVFLLPIVHAEADYKATLFVGDELTIQVTVERIGEHSFTLFYDLLNIDRQSAGTVRTVHVCIDRTTGKKKLLPEDLRQCLAKTG